MLICKIYYQIIKLRLLFTVIDCLNTIYGMKDEKDLSYYYNEVLHFQEFVILFRKIIYALLVFKILDNNKYSFLMDLITF